MTMRARLLTLSLVVGLFPSIVFAQVVDTRTTCNDARPCSSPQTCVDLTCRQPIGGNCTADNQCTTGATCVASTPPSGTCAVVSGTTPSSSATTEEPEPPFESLTPKLGVPIPGFTFSPATKDSSGVHLPFLPEYINAVYRYMVGIVLIAAIVMVVYGGFRYLLGSSVGDISKGKTIIRDAIVGMLLVIGAYTILNTINPATTTFKVLTLEFVEHEGLVTISSADYEAATGEPPLGSSETIALGREVASTMGIDPCEAEAVIRGESGGRSNAIGYDANVPRVGIFSRRIFIHSGRRYSGSTFPVPPGDWEVSGCRPSGNVTPAQEAAILDRTIRNDDRFNPSAPPDFGIDDRFSIGIGTFQVTLIPESGSCRLPRCSNGYLGRVVDGTCYSVPELLDARTQTTAGLAIYRRAREGCASQRDEYTRLRCAFARFAGVGDSARVSSCNKMKHYARCTSTSHREREDCGSWRGTDDDVADDYTSN